MGRKVKCALPHSFYNSVLKIDPKSKIKAETNLEKKKTGKNPLGSEYKSTGFQRWFSFMHIFNDCLLSMRQLCTQLTSHVKSFCNMKIADIPFRGPE